MKKKSIHAHPSPMQRLAIQSGMNTIVEEAVSADDDCTDADMSLAAVEHPVVNFPSLDNSVFLPTASQVVLPADRKEFLSTLNAGLHRIFGVSEIVFVKPKENAEHEMYFERVSPDDFRMVCRSMLWRNRFGLRDIFDMFGTMERTEMHPEGDSLPFHTAAEKCFAQVFGTDKWSAMRKASQVLDGNVLIDFLADVYAQSYSRVAQVASV